MHIARIHYKSFFYQELLKEQDYENTHEHTKNLKAAYKEIVKDPHGSDMLNYFSYYTDIFYDDVSILCVDNVRKD